MRLLVIKLKYMYAMYIACDLLSLSGHCFSYTHGYYTLHHFVLMLSAAPSRHRAPHVCQLWRLWTAEYVAVAEALKYCLESFAEARPSMPRVHLRCRYNGIGLARGRWKLPLPRVSRRNTVIRIGINLAAFLGMLLNITPSPSWVSTQLLATHAVTNIENSVLLYYDYLLTLADEVRLFWGSKSGIASVLFFINRYFALAGNVPILVLFIDPRLQILNPRPQRACPIYSLIWNKGTNNIFSLYVRGMSLVSAHIICVMLTAYSAYWMAWIFTSAFSTSWYKSNVQVLSIHDYTRTSPDAI